MIKDQSFGVIPVITKNSEYTFLLIQHNEGHWAFPKGHANKGETEEETAKREFFEETGISNVALITGRQFTENYTFKSKTGELIKKTVYYYIGKVRSGIEVKIQQEEIQNFRWCNFNEAYDLITFKPGKEMLKQVKEYLDREWIKEIISKDNWMMEVLKTVQELDLPDSWVGAGFIRNKIWDILHNYSEKTPLEDVDVIYFNPENIEEASEKEIDKKLSLIMPDVRWSAKNQARMHLKNGDKPYKNSEEALSRWIETPTCIGVCLNSDNQLELIAPHSVQDLVNLEVKPSPTDRMKKNPEIFMQRVKSKNWATKWPQLKINE